MEHGDLRLTVTEAKSIVRIGESYDILCRLTNSSERSMDLQLYLNTTAKLGCGYTGASEFMVMTMHTSMLKYIFYLCFFFNFFFKQIGTIESEKSKEFKLTVCPVRLGLISIGHLQLTDVFLKQTYDFEDFVQVYVVDANYRDDEHVEIDKYVQYGLEKLSLSTSKM